MADGKKIGAKIVLDGEAEFRQSINNSKSALKAFDSELKLTQAEFKNNEKSLEALRKTQQTYAKQQEQLQKQEKAYIEQLSKANEAHKNATKIHEDTAKEIEKLKKQLEEAKKQYGENSEEVTKLNAELEKSEAQYKKEETAISGLENKMNKWEQGLNETRTSLVEVNNNLEEVNGDIDNFGKEVEDAGDATAKANPEINELSLSMGKLVSAELIAEGIKRLASSVVDLAQASVDVGMKFEASMSKVEALSGSTADEMEVLTEKAREMGATTMFSASEAADAFSYMALAGWDTKQMLEGIEPVLNLAASANMDLAEASDIVTDYLTAFGLKAQDASKFTDQLAYAMANSNTDVEMLGEAYKNCAAAAGSMGYSVEDVTAALMTMANAGVKGGEAGTSLRAIMINLATNTKGCADKLAEYGVQVYDTNGKMRNLSDILVDTAGAFEGLSDQESNALAKTIAGKTQYTGFQTVMLGLGEATKETGQSMTDYASALSDCDGYAKQMADTMQNNLQGKLTILQSALEALGESAYDVFKDDLKDGVDVATEAITRLNESVKKGDLNTSLKRVSESVNKLIDKVADWMESSLPKLLDGLADIIDNADKIVPVLEAIVAGFIAFKTASTAVELASGAMTMYQIATQLATGAQLELNLAVEANPIGLIAAAIAGVIVLIHQWSEANKKQAEETINNAKKITQAYNDMADSLSNTSTDNKQLLIDLDAERTHVEGLVTELDELNKKESLTADERARVSSIVGELNSKYKDLNLTIDSETGKLTDNTDAWKKNIDEQLNLAQMEAINERLTDQYKKQFDAQVSLQEAQNTLNEAKKEEQEIMKGLSQLYSDDIAVNQQTIDKKYELEQALEANRVKQEELTTAVENEKTALDESQSTLDAMTTAYDNLQGSTTALADATVTTTDTIVQKSEEWQQAYDNALDSAQQSLDGQNILFEKLKTTVEQSVGDMANNIAANTEVFSQFADDLQKASELANNSSDPNFKAIVANIESMGIDGAGYLHELVEAAETNTTDFNKLLEEWAAMETAKAELADTMATFEADYQTGTDNMMEIQQKYKDDTETSTTELTENVKQTISTANEEINQNIDNTLTTAEQSFANAIPVVQANAEQLGSSAKTAVEEYVNRDTFYEMGSQAGQGLADGLRSQVENVKAAAKELADAAKTTVSGPTGLDEHSPSKKMHEYGYLGGIGLAEGFEESMPEVVDTINSMMPNDNNVEVSSIQNVNMNANSEGNGTLSQISSMLTEYLPVLSKMKVMLDSKILVGQLTPGINEELGKISSRRV